MHNCIRRTFDDNISYLLNVWTEREVKRFVKQTEFVISRLQEYPESYIPSLKNKKKGQAQQIHDAVLSLLSCQG
jgi:hypothetical protein